MEPGWDGAYTDSDSIPYRKLLCAVIGQAFEDLEFTVKFPNKGGVSPTTLRGRIAKVRNEMAFASSAHYWLTREDFSRVFSFINICDYLDLSFEALKSEAKNKYMENKGVFENKLEQLEGRYAEMLNCKEEGGCSQKATMDGYCYFHLKKLKGLSSGPPDPKPKNKTDLMDVFDRAEDVDVEGLTN